MRHFADQHKVGIDPGAAVLQPGAKTMGATDIFRPYRGGQAILRVIRPAQGLRFIAERRHADYRTKHFALDNSVFLPGAGEQRRLEVIARAVSGVISEGFITTQLPAASAGASFQAAIISG